MRRDLFKRVVPSPEQCCGHEAAPDGTHPVHPVEGPVVCHHRRAEGSGRVQAGPGHVPAEVSQ